MSKTRRYVVDRAEGEVLVLVDEQGGVVDIARDQLPRSCRAAGAVLDVPLDVTGVPRFSEAMRNRQEEDRRRRESAALLERLRKTDPGGDVTL